MIWIILGVVVISLILFAGKFNKDTNDLEHEKLHEKFEYIVENLNQYAFNGEGQVYEINMRTFNLGATESNQMITFEYGAGGLTIIWKYKYYQKEVVDKKYFPKVRNLSIFEQEKISQLMIMRMEKIVEQHKSEVMNDF